MRGINDEAEMTHGLELAKSVIAEERGKATDPKRQEYLDELTRLLTEVEVEPVYIACFCEAVDRLSQWRADGRTARASAWRSNQRRSGTSPGRTVRRVSD